MGWDYVKNLKTRKIIEILYSGSHTPKQLAEKMNLHEVTVSRYLKILKKDNLVKIKRKQNQLFYSLNQNQWKKHVEATIDLAGSHFVSQLNQSIQEKPIVTSKKNNFEVSVNQMNHKKTHNFNNKQLIPKNKKTDLTVSITKINNKESLTYNPTKMIPGISYPIIWEGEKLFLLKPDQNSQEVLVYEKLEDDE